MNIGKYNLERMNDGRWTLQWMDPETRHRQIVRMDDFESCLDEMVRPRQEHLKLLCEYFHNAMLDHEAFYRMPMCQRLVDCIPAKMPYYPGAYQNFTWYLQWAIESYAGLTGVRFRIDEVEPHVLEVRRSFQDQVGTEYEVP